jgi:hypothetical protein
VSAGAVVGLGATVLSVKQAISEKRKTEGAKTTNRFLKTLGNHVNNTRNKETLKESSLLHPKKPAGN